MWGLISDFFKGFGVGRIVSDVDPLNQSNVASTQTDKQVQLNPYKTNSANQNALGAAGTIWVGMRTSQLLESIGPALTKQYRGSREIWTYLSLHGQGTKTAVAIENGAVINWQDMHTNAYNPVRSRAR